MDCPVCKDQKLVMSDRQGIEIDYCPNCRGVWLDRGELDKIIDKSADAVPQQVQQPARNDPYQGQPYNSQGPGYSQPSQGYPHPQHGYYKKKRKGFLGELFDF
jgi:Zn-finger nucleic acid-binding protein